MTQHHSKAPETGLTRRIKHSIFTKGRNPGILWIETLRALSLSNGAASCSKSDEDESIVEEPTTKPEKQAKRAPLSWTVNIC